MGPHRYFSLLSYENTLRIVWECDTVESALLLCFLCFFLPLLVSVELWSVLLPEPLIEVLELLLPV